MNLKELQAKIIKLAHTNSDIEVLWLYGSQAKGTAHDKSDIDLAVVFKNWEKDPLERRLRPELLAIEWLRTLSLKEGDLSIIDMNIAPIPLAMSVLQSGCLLLCKNKSRQYREQQRIMSIWEIDYLYHYQNKQRLYG
jgi:hypothetical protein